MSSTFELITWTANSTFGASATMEGVLHGRRHPGRPVAGREKSSFINYSPGNNSGCIPAAAQGTGHLGSCHTETFDCDTVHFCTFFSKKDNTKNPHTDYRLDAYTDIPCCYFLTGKEKDTETGYGYFGARYMDHELMTMWLSVDPMADKYPSISPYAYCAWNPVKLVDPDGKEVYITGEHADRAVAQLQTSNMEISRSENGLLSVDLHGKTRDDLSKEERLVYDAINSTKVSINITAQKTNLRDGKYVFSASIDGVTNEYECLYGGSNMGSYYDPNTHKALSVGLIDKDMLDANGFDQGVAHEVSEYYIAGCIAIRDQSDIPKAVQNVENPRMMEAHKMAIPETVPKGGIYQFGIQYGNFGKIK